MRSRRKLVSASARTGSRIDPIELESGDQQAESCALSFYLPVLSPLPYIRSSASISLDLAKSAGYDRTEEQGVCRCGELPQARPRSAVWDRDAQFDLVYHGFTVPPVAPGADSCNCAELSAAPVQALLPIRILQPGAGCRRLHRHHLQPGLQQRVRHDESLPELDRDFEQSEVAAGHNVRYARAHPRRNLAVDRV